MYNHVVMWKFKSSILESDISKMISLLDGLKEKIPLIINLDVALDISEKNASFDIILRTSFNNISDFKKYMIDINHQKVVEYIKTIVDERAVVDYITE